MGSRDTTNPYHLSLQSAHIEVNSISLLNEGYIYTCDVYSYEGPPHIDI